jgi:hypothetical protein
MGPGGRRSLRSGSLLARGFVADSVNSQNVTDEVSLAFDARKRIVPVLLKKCDIPFRLRRLQYVDLTDDYARGACGIGGRLKV